MKAAILAAGLLAACHAHADLVTLPAEWTLCGSSRPQACQPGTTFPDGATVPRYHADAAAMGRLEAMAWPDLSLRADSLRVLGAINALAEDTPVTESGMERLVSEVYFARSGRDISRDVRYMGLGVYLERAAEDPVALAGREVWQRWPPDVKRHVLDHLEVPARPEHLDIPSTRDPAHLATLAALQTALKAGGAGKVLFVTGGLDYGLAEVAFYRQALNAAGVQGIWLPLEPAFFESRRENDCGHMDHYRARDDRARVYPELDTHQVELCEHRERLQSLLAEADALLLAVVDDKALHALLFDAHDRPRAWWSQLSERFRRAELTLIVHGDADAVAAIRQAAAR